MNIVDNWRTVLKHAWSVRLILLAGVLTGIEGALNLIGPYALPIPPGLFTVLAFIVMAAAFVARFVVQRKLSGAPNENDL